MRVPGLGLIEAQYIQECLKYMWVHAAYSLFLAGIAWLVFGNQTDYLKPILLHHLSREELENE